MSLADFWGESRCWTRIFSEFARYMIFWPLSRINVSRAASFAFFVFSGLLHELLWSVSGGRRIRRADGVLLLLQGLCVQIEEHAPGETSDLQETLGRPDVDLP